MNSWLRREKARRKVKQNSAGLYTDATGQPLNTPGFKRTIFTAPNSGTTFAFCPLAKDTWKTPERPINRYVVSCDIKMTSCCGIKDLYGIDYGWSTEDMLCLIVEQYSLTLKYGYRKGRVIALTFLELDQFLRCCHPYFIFSSGKGHLGKVRETLAELQVGKLTSFGPACNPTGSAELEMAIYEPDKEALLSWYVEQRKKYEASHPELAQKEAA